MAETTELRSLGLKASSRLDLAGKVRRGVTYAAVRNFQKTSVLTEKRIAAAARIPARTWSRRKREGKFSPEESDRIARLVRLFELAERILGSRQATRRWLEEPSLALGGQTPLGAAETEFGAMEVEALLVRTEHGVYS